MSVNGQCEPNERRDWMSVMAKAGPEDLEAAWQNLPDKPEFKFLRPPEAGLVMVQARAGNTGRRFNLGEMTVTRCAVRIDSGQTGVAYVAGRHFRQAELAALCDALLQHPARQPGVKRLVLEPLKAAQDQKQKARAVQTSSTKVDFFTMVRGDD